ncbi:MAG: anaerobic ribonucleoside-triphosphate reductase activating protein [Lachnospiraceae bacterium]|nr:anaerobic ribonucleoside-triphosphate reductase activating protein [Lachnospiraceae bacterium]
MNFMDIKTLDIANGPGCRISLFVSGCRRHCKECFNPESWDFNHGDRFTEEVASKIITLLKPAYMDGLTILGGEPFEAENQVELLPFLRRVRENYPDLSIWMYTGYNFEDLYTSCDQTREILSMIDVLVDGEFRIELKDIKLQYCGSTNQRVIDMKETLKSKMITVYHHYDFSKGSSPVAMLPVLH